MSIAERLEQANHVSKSRKNDHEMENLMASADEVEADRVIFLWDLLTVSVICSLFECPFGTTREASTAQDNAWSDLRE